MVWLLLGGVCLVSGGAVGLAAAGQAPTMNPAAKAGPAQRQPRPKGYALVHEADELFGLTNLWTLDLRFEPPAWEEMQPEGRLPPARPPVPPWERSPQEGPTGRTPGPRPPDQGRENRPPTGLDFRYVRATLEFRGQTYPDIGVRYKGNSTFRAAGNSLKRSLKLDFNRFRRSQKFYGLTKLNLNNNAMDPSQVREALAYEVFRASGLPASRTAFARLYLTVPGKLERQFVGLYTVVEEVDDHFLRLHYGTKKGLLLKPGLMPGPSYLGEDWAPYQQRYAPKSQVDSQDAQQLIAFTKLIDEADERAFGAQLASYVEPAHLLRFLAVEAALANLDSPLFTGHNYYLYLHPGTGRFHFLPWDLNEAFGGFFVAGTPAQQMDLSIAHPFGPRNRLFERLLASPERRAAFRQQFKDLLATSLRPEKLLADLAALRNALGPTVMEDKSVASEAFEQNFTENALPGALADSAPTATALGPERPGLRATAGDFPGMRLPKPPLRPFITGRLASIRAQLEGQKAGYTPRGRGPGQPPEMAGGPGFLLAPGVMRAADANQDEKISCAEFIAAFDRWFSRWDADESGSLDVPKLAAGLTTLLPPPPELGVPRPEGPRGFADRPGAPGLEPLPGPPAGLAPGPEGQVAPGAGPQAGPVPDGPPVWLFARQILQAADANQDGLIPRQEWRAAVSNWFMAWDADKSGALDPRKLGEGLNQLIGPPPGPGRTRRAPGFPRQPAP
jgi:hypothetical protein